jgi:hypothetical protein
MVSLAIFCLMLQAVMQVHLQGLRLFQINSVKLTAAGDHRRCFNQLSEDVRTAELMRVGQGSQTSFSEAARNTEQQGNAVQLYPSAANTSQYIRYYWDRTTKSLRRRAADGTVTEIVGSVLDGDLFTLENGGGQVLTNRSSRCVLRVSLELTALRDPRDKVGAGQHYSAYRLQTRVASRTAN